MKPQNSGMTAKYTRIPMSENEGLKIDFSSAFQYGGMPGQHATSSNGGSSRYFSYEGNDRDHNRREPDDVAGPTTLTRCYSNFVEVLCYILVCITIPVSGWFVFKVCKQFERVVIFRLGRRRGVKGPGVTMVLPCLDRYTVVDMRTKAFSVPPIQVFTSDNGVIETGADVHYRVTDPVHFVTSVQDPNHALRELTKTSLRNQLTKLELTDIQNTKISICTATQADVNKTCSLWGLEVGRIEMSAVKIISMPEPANPLNKLLGGSIGSGLPAGIMGAFQQIAAHASSTGPVQASPTVPSIPAPSPVASASTRTLTTPQDIIEAVRPLLSEGLVRNFGTVYEFILKIDEDAKDFFFLDLKTGNGSVGKGKPPSGPADVTFTLDQDTLHSLMTGRMGAMQAYITGQLSVTGDTNAAMKLEVLIDKLKL
ncbi:stomatin-like protein 1 isoform X1 [Lingula anatina]|uniref:Stomatin-like protein 1 isoform X1 n=2 Tax=Lingula anatina TaxID=7574 RepID=A0A1S3I7N0_LINAN|nr:stomatin-like protein 1 isoform X1 [Lingula anatina]|eukprot:XP_013394267.1 stomatin-like protein 1 isoform X1 [Lingula anatina]